MMGHAQDVDEFENFLNAELNDFDTFMSNAEKEFVNFLRNPWVELEGKKPLEKEKKPKPVKPTEFNKQKDPVPTTPKQIDIQSILDLTSSEGKQKPVVEVRDVDRIPSDVPGAKKKQPTVIIKEETTVEKPKKVEPVIEKPKREEPIVLKPQKEEPIVGKPKKVEPIVEKPKKVEPVVEQPKKVEPIVEKPVVTPPTTKPTVKPSTPNPNTTSSSPLYTGGGRRTKIQFGGRNVFVSNSIAGACRLRNLNEDAIADAYEAMYETEYQQLLNECKQVQRDMNLNDWGMFMLIQSVSNAFYSNANESVVMQQFLLNELGYKAKMARKKSNNKMLLFVATNCKLYGYPYFENGGKTYYCTNDKEPSAFFLCKKDAPKAKNSLRMHIGSAPLFDGATATSTHQAQGSSKATVTATVPKTLMDFYKSYPQCDFTVYAQAPVNEGVRQQILSSLKPYIQGKSEQEAANILINFVQTGFDYATDDEQFGYEKPFFVEEVFYYPKCDCEDRSIFYSFLIRNLLGLDVVLLDYPDHIATAVRFNEPVNGDYISVDGKRYTICDPTYIGANIGAAMPHYKSVAVNVIKF